MKNLNDYIIHEDNTIMDALAVIERNESRCVIVLNENEKVVGVFSQGDVIRLLLRRTDLQTPLQNVVKPSFKYATVDKKKNAVKMLKEGYTLMPIVDNEFHLLEVLTIFDLFSEEKPYDEGN